MAKISMAAARAGMQMKVQETVEPEMSGATRMKPSSTKLTVQTKHFPKL